MIWKEKKDPLDQELREFFAEVYKETDMEDCEDLADIQMASWEEIERMADEIEQNEAAERSVSGLASGSEKVYGKRKKRLAVAILAATMGLLFAGVVNGNRLYEYMVGQQWRNGQTVFNVDSNKVLADGEDPYKDAVEEIFEKTGVQSIQPMDHSWELVEYEIEGKLSYMTFSNGEDTISIKQRSYAGVDITMQSTNDKRYLGNEQSAVFPELQFDIYCEKTINDKISYEASFVLEDVLYVIRGACEEEKYRKFLREVYIKRTLE